MLQTLDPHSSFMDPDSYARLRERQEGRYYGLGISINVIDGDITVMSIFEGSPAYRSGLRRGDVIARITGQNAKDMTSDDAVRLLRGPKGTAVDISIRRTGYDELIDLTVERDEITIATIQAAFVVDGGTGYVKLGDFSETSDRDLGRALRRLRDDGMQRLILDLRNNPGGPLDQAIKVSNQFLPRGNLIVYTRGRVENSDQDYHATADGEFTDIPLVVLVNRNSASAVRDRGGRHPGSRSWPDRRRDHFRQGARAVDLPREPRRRPRADDRALLHAERPHDSATLGRYVRRVSDLLDARAEYPLAFSRGPQVHDRRGARYTAAAASEPDHRIAGPIEGFDPSRLGRLLAARQEFASFAERFSAEGDRRIAGVSQGRKLVVRGFAIDDALLEEFKEHVRGRGLTVDDAAFAEDLDFIRAMMRYCD